VFTDGDLEYYNLFDAMVDAFVAAMVRVVQQEDVKLVVAETGWPTAGGRMLAPRMLESTTLI
jgi:exo-beta-1,3-glucanase (GH17 family)